MIYREKLVDFVEMDLNWMSKNKIMFPNAGGDFSISIEDKTKNVNGANENCSKISVYYKKGTEDEVLYETDNIHRGEDFRHIYYEVMQLGLEKLKTK